MTFAVAPPARSRYVQPQTLIIALLLVTLLAIHADVSLAANLVREPIRNGRYQIHIKPFATIPKYKNKQPRVNAMTYFGGKDIFVVTEHSGIIYKIRNGKVSLWFNVADAIFASTGRRLDIFNTVHGGLRSLAFHPQFAKNGKFYVAAMETRPKSKSGHKYLSDASGAKIGADSVLIEFTANSATGIPFKKSYREVFRVGLIAYDHPIKQLAFRGNLLYISHGDGSVLSSNKVGAGGQGKNALGKILRINPLKSGSKSYTVPKGNPFIGKPFMIDEVWAYGFRNPHTISFSKRGELLVGDAGRDNSEEVNLVLRGGNYGWPLREGTFVHKNKGGVVNGVSSLPKDDFKRNFRYPAAQLGHNGPLGTDVTLEAIAGGYPVENGSPLNGLYLYADFPLTGDIFYSFLGAIRRAKTKGVELTQAKTYRASVYMNGSRYRNLGEVIKKASSYDGSGRADVRFGRGPNGEVYILNKRNGIIYKVLSSMKGGPGDRVQ